MYGGDALNTLYQQTIAKAAESGEAK